METITILGLHLGYGGVEQSIITQANSLCNNYNVELVVSYKLLPNPAFELDSRVKIKYLTNLKPNRNEFLAYLKAKRFLKAFKEGLKSLKILYLKKNTMQKYIRSCNSNIIISSRIEIGKLLSKNKKKNIITITEEHCHHNNNKRYIANVKKTMKKLDYLVLVSKELQEDYAQVINPNKCIYIPNSLDYWPAKTSSLNNKNLVSVGRLSPEKGYMDLIEVMSIVVKKDNNVHLDIIGDGVDYKQIETKIKNYRLKNNITMHGFQNKEYIRKIESSSSLYVMCSHEESFGIVIIEAGSLGIPSIIFDSATGATEIIKDQKSGIIITDRNKEAMANKIIELLNDPYMLKKMGENAREESQKYSFENVKKIWLNFIEKVK